MFAERLVLSAEDISTNSSSEHLAPPKAQAFSLVAVNVNVHEVSTIISEKYYGCELTERSKLGQLWSSKRRPTPMPLARWRTYRERAWQKRKALRMLALSGVVRPSHVELRYTIPILKVGTSNASPCTMPTAVNQQSAPLQECSAIMRTRGKQLLQWLHQRLPFKKAPESLGLNYRGLTGSL